MLLYHFHLVSSWLAVYDRRGSRRRREAARILSISILPSAEDSYCPRPTRARRILTDFSPFTGLSCWSHLRSVAETPIFQIRTRDSTVRPIRMTSFRQIHTIELHTPRFAQSLWATSAL